MSQEQPKSFPHYQALAAQAGYHAALKDASKDVDGLTDALGRRMDLARVIKASVFVSGVIVGLAIAYLTACGTIHESAAPGWPNLEVRVQKVGLLELQKRCGKYLTPLQFAASLGIVGGCAEINFAAMRCDIWLPIDETDPSFEQHERQHCAGMDHYGDSTLRDAWTTYRSR